MFGTGCASRFDGHVANIDHMDFPHFDRVKALWKSRVQPEVKDTDTDNSSPFSDIKASMVTVFLWGRSVAQVECGGSVIFARTDAGQLYCWGGNTTKWKYVFNASEGLMGEDTIDNMNQIHSNVGTTASSNIEEGNQDIVTTSFMGSKMHHHQTISSSTSDIAKTTARSRLLKLTMPSNLKFDSKKRERDPFYRNYAEMDEPTKVQISKKETLQGMTFLGRYYDVPELRNVENDADIPENVEELVRAKLSNADLKHSLRLRGVKTTNKPYPILEMEMMEYIMLELECMGEEFHESMKRMDIQARELRSQHLSQDLEK